VADRDPTYTPADVDLVADAIVDARLRGFRDWSDRPARAVLAALAAAGRLAPVDDDPRHVIEFRPDGWTIMHPLSCRPNLFECPVNRVAEMDLGALGGPPVPPGRYECELNDLGDRLLIGDRIEP
jgi:hypothetical protein